LHAEDNVNHFEIVPPVKLSICGGRAFSVSGLIGAGAIELAGARAPHKFLTAGVRGHNRIYGAPVKMKKKD